MYVRKGNMPRVAEKTFLHNSTEITGPEEMPIGKKSNKERKPTCNDNKTACLLALDEANKKINGKHKHASWH